MSNKSSGGGSGNMLLLAGLGIGAFMLFANKSNADAGSSGGGADQLLPGSGRDIPDAPKILAVNSSDSESPIPTAIVSDESGMEQTTELPYSSTGSNASSSSSGSNAAVRTASAGSNSGKNEQPDYEEIPSIISTKLTPQEQGVINAGKLTAELALKRPDLYKATYIKQYGGKTPATKRAALIKASLAVDTAVRAATAASNGGLKKATAYPAKPEHTFVQSAGGMAAQLAITQMAALQKKGVKVSPAAKKVSAQVKAAKSKAPVKTVKKKVKPAPVKKKVAARTPAKKKAAAPKKRVVKKKR